MARASRSSRQLFMVDLVTLLLLVLIVALRVEADPDTGTPGQKEALVFRFDILEENRDEEAAPTIGVAYVRNNDSPILSKPFGMEEGELVKLIDVGRTVIVEVYEAAASRDDNKCKLVVFARDRGQFRRPDLSVNCAYFNSVDSEWVPVYHKRQGGDIKIIEMINAGELVREQALVVIELNGVRRDGGKKPTWEPIGGFNESD